MNLGRLSAVSIHLSSYWTELLLKGRNPAGKRIRKSCFIEWTILFQRQASGDKFLVPVSCAPVPYQLLPFYFHQCVHRGAGLSFAMCSANEAGGLAGVLVVTNVCGLWEN